MVDFTGATFSEVKDGANEVADHIRNLRARQRALRDESNALATAIAVFGNEYGSIVPASAALLSADPSNPAVMVLDAEIQKYLADFNTLSSEINALNALVNPA